MHRITKLINEFKTYFTIIVKRQHRSRGGVFILFDMVWCLVRYGARPIDYNRFEFEKKSGRERNRYFTYFRYSNLYKKLDRETVYKLSAQKSCEYTIYRDFIHRDWMLVDSTTDIADITRFITKHGEVIVKPERGEQGNGIYKVKIDDIKNMNKLFNDIESKSYIIEELVRNCDDLSIINPTSLNTVRVYTLITKTGDTKVLAVMLRVGRLGNQVDNWGSGGIGYNIDLETGICCQYGLDKLNNRYVFHPESNVKMVGFELPKYNELIDYIQRICKVEPKARYVGWDIAITPSGFELIEMNLPGGHDFLQVFGTPCYDVIKKNW